MSDNKGITVTEADVALQVEALKGAAARSTDACLTAKYIALTDPRVLALLLKKLQAGHVFVGVDCPPVVSVPETKSVLFDFNCRPGTFCLIKPSFLVVVNLVGGFVEAIVDPYVHAAPAAPALAGCDNCRS